MAKMWSIKRLQTQAVFAQSRNASAYAGCSTLTTESVDNSVHEPCCACVMPIRMRLLLRSSALRWNKLSFKINEMKTAVSLAYFAVATLLLYYTEMSGCELFLCSNSSKLDYCCANDVCRDEKPKLGWSLYRLFFTIVSFFADLPIWLCNPARK